MPEIQETVQVVPGSKLLWRIAARPSHSSQVELERLTQLGVVCMGMQSGNCSEINR